MTYNLEVTGPKFSSVRKGDLYFIDLMIPEVFFFFILFFIFLYTLFRSSQLDNRGSSMRGSTVRRRSVKLKEQGGNRKRVGAGAGAAHNSRQLDEAGDDDKGNTHITDAEMLSFWRNFHHWLHLKLSFWLTANLLDGCRIRTHASWYANPHNWLISLLAASFTHSAVWNATKTQRGPPGSPATRMFKV